MGGVEDLAAAQERILKLEKLLKEAKGGQRD